MYTEYNISVRAYTSVGPGPYSVGVVERTDTDGELATNIVPLHLTYCFHMQNLMLLLRM